METTIKLLKKPIVSIIIAVFCSFIVLTLILICSGYNPISAYQSLYGGIFGRPKYVSNVIIKSTPIIMTGLGVAFAFKTGLFNIGAEGQYIVGSVAAVMVGCTLNIPGVILVPLCLLVGAAAGAVWGGICGILKAKYGINEVIVSIMLNWIALYLNNFILNLNVFHQDGTVASKTVNSSATIMLLPHWKLSDQGLSTMRNYPVLYDFFVRTDVNFGILIAIVMCVLISILLYKTVKGYQLRAVGFNAKASELSGINVKANIAQTMFISGAICGLAGAMSILGTNPHRISQLTTFENNGFNGLSVAFIAMSNPVGCIFAGLLFGALLYGGQQIQVDMGVPTEVINIIIGTIVYFVALTSIMPVLVQKLEKKQRAKQQTSKEAN